MAEKKYEGVVEHYLSMLSMITQMPDIQLEVLDGKWEPLIDQEYQKDSFTLGDYRAVSGEHEIAAWSLFAMPRCCAYCISGGARVSPQFQKMGVGKLMNTFRQEIARHLGFSALLCTDVEHNAAQRKILRDNGWKDVHSVINKRTDNHVFLSVINL